MTPGEQLARVLTALPPLLWAALAAYVVWLLRGSLAAAIGRITSLEAFSVKLAMSGTQAMSRIAESGDTESLISTLEIG